MSKYDEEENKLTSLFSSWLFEKLERSCNDCVVFRSEIDSKPLPKDKCCVVCSLAIGKALVEFELIKWFWTGTGWVP